MSQDYDEITAIHYAAYRPALHETILEQCIPRTNDFLLGLDIGCGTGHSSIALTRFCEKVIGIDPSKSMIESAIEHSNVEYQYFDGTVRGFESNIFDIVTFAGSLYYAKSQRLLDEVVRVTKHNGLVVVYDFEILLDRFLHKLGFKSIGTNTYDHEADFSGLQNNSIFLATKKKETIQIEITSANMAHLILSVKEQYLFFDEQLGRENLHHKLSDRLFMLADSNSFLVDTNLYNKVYKALE